MNLEDVIYFYVGNEVLIQEEDGETFTDFIMFANSNQTVWCDEAEDVPISRIKLVLRPLHHMRKYEEEKYYSLCKPVGKSIRDTPESLAYLIKRRFDVFNLIAQKEAIQKQNKDSSDDSLEQWIKHE